jgi:cation diffusion facilitator family transporter
VEGFVVQPKQRQQQAQRVAGTAIATNIALTAAKVVVGLASGSTAVLADAFHSGSDIAASAIVFVGVRLAGAPPDRGHHYGHAKLESVAAKVVSLVLLATAMLIAINAYGVLQEGSISPPTSLALWFTGAAILIKEILFRYVLAAGNRLESTALLAEAWHHRSDAISSVAALVGVAGARMGYPGWDALAGMAVAALIGLMAVKLYVQSVRELIDEAPAEVVLTAIVDAALNTEGVLCISEVKARRNGPVVLVDLKMCVNRFITVEAGHQIAGKAKDAIMKANPEVGDVLVHVNPCYRVGGSDESPLCEGCIAGHIQKQPREET